MSQTEALLIYINSYPSDLVYNAMMGKKKIRIFINGFGRIGRSAARIILDDESMELVGINDLYSFEQIAYLLRYDSVYHTCHHKIRLDGNRLLVKGETIKLFRENDPSNIDLRAMDIDTVLECSGVFLTAASNRQFLDSGAKKVIISTPPKDTMPVYMFGINHMRYQQESIISNSSCSANAIVPILKIADSLFGVESAGMSMYHSYTNYQHLLDSGHYSSDIRRTRSATQNIIPLQSTAAEATAYFFPQLREKLAAKSIRIPISATTLYDLIIKLSSHTSEEEARRLFQAEVSRSFSNILDTTDTIEESDRYIQNPYSAVIILPLIQVVGGNMLRVSAWQDNEYGYAKRLVDLAKSIG